MGLAALALSGCGGVPGDAELAAAIDAQLAPHVASGDLSGAVVAGREDRVVYARGFHLADAESRTPFTPETPIPLGAAAETVTAAAVWLLAEEGRLELDAPVQRYLARFPWPEPTLRHLLSHSAGLTDHPPHAPAGKAQKKQGVEKGAERRAPGEVYQLSPAGYELLADVIEAVERRPFEGFVRERLLDRLGIALPGTADGGPALALSYRREEGWLKPDPIPPAPGFTGGEGLALSALDLFRWCVSFYAEPVLREETLKRGAAPAELAGGGAAVDQLGWTRADAGRRYRMAVDGGHTVFAYRDERRRFGVVYVSNTAMPTGLRPRLARALVGVLEGAPPERIEVPPAAPLPQDHEALVSGEYALPGLGRLELAQHGGGLVARLDGGPWYRVGRAGETHLHVSGLDAWLAFDEPGEQGFQRVGWSSVFHAARGERLADGPSEKESQP